MIDRAHEVMDNLVAGSEGTAVVVPQRQPGDNLADPGQAAKARQQLSFLTEIHPMLEEIRTLELDDLTPREALDVLYRVKASLDEGKDF